MSVEPVVPTMIIEKTWEEGSEPSEYKKVWWEGSVLSVPIEYCGRRRHPFTAKLLDISTRTCTVYTLFLEDTMRTADPHEAIISDTIKIEMKGITRGQATFIVLEAGWNDTAIKVAETKMRFACCQGSFVR